MKSFKNILRLWISFTSLFGFLGAWAMLAQTFKPVQAQQAQSLPATAYPTLTELAPIDLNATTQPTVALQVVIPTPTPFPTPVPQPVILWQPRLVTGGS
jgi:hypothetical protein